MNYSDVPGTIVSREWSQFSNLISNVFLVRCYSVSNQFRMSLAIGYLDVNSVPIIVSQKNVFVQEAIWQRVVVPLLTSDVDRPMQIYGRISDTKWGTRGAVYFSLKEGGSMIYSNVSIEDLSQGQVVVNAVYDGFEYEGNEETRSILTLPGNPKRMGGFLRNGSSVGIHVHYGPLTGFSFGYPNLVPPGGSIDIPVGYLGPIFVGGPVGDFSSTLIGDYTQYQSA